MAMGDKSWRMNYLVWYPSETNLRETARVIDKAISMGMKSAETFGLTV